MDLLPTEIKLLIASNFDNKTQLVMRAVTKEWLNLIEITNYTFYGTTKSELWQIARKLKHIQKPISLTLHKNVCNEMKDISNALSRLYNLTELNINGILYENSKDQDLQHWMRLTELTNLRRIKAPLKSKDFFLRFPNLEVFVSKSIKKADQQTFDRICELTELQKLWLTFDAYNPLSVDNGFTNLNKLTKLHLTFRCREDTFNKEVVPNLCRNFTGVKDLWLKYVDTFAHFTPQLDPISLEELTSLEKLQLSEVVCRSLNSTNLTQLEIYNITNRFLSENASSLVNLKILFASDMNKDTFTRHCLRALTALEDLFIDRHVEESEDLFEYFNASRLTALSLYVISPCIFSRLTSLVDLKLNTSDEYFLQQAYQLQGLTSLSVNCLYDAEIDVSKLPRLETLDLDAFQTRVKSVKLTSTLLTLQISKGASPNRFHELDFSDLPYLEELQVPLDQPVIGLSALTTLTRLEVYFEGKGRCSLKFMMNMTNLKEFEGAGIAEALPYLVNATNLLSITGLISKPEELDVLIRLTNLTKLLIESTVSDDHLLKLTKLTSLKYLCIRNSLTTVDLLRPHLPKLWQYNGVSTEFV